MNDKTKAACDEIKAKFEEISHGLNDQEYQDYINDLHSHVMLLYGLTPRSRWAARPVTIKLTNFAATPEPEPESLF